MRRRAFSKSRAITATALTGATAALMARRASVASSGRLSQFRNCTCYKPAQRSVQTNIAAFWEKVSFFPTADCSAAHVDAIKQFWPVHKALRLASIARPNSAFCHHPVSSFLIAESCALKSGIIPIAIKIRNAAIFSLIVGKFFHFLELSCELRLRCSSALCDKHLQHT